MLVQTTCALQMPTDHRSLIVLSISPDMLCCVAQMKLGVSVSLATPLEGPDIMSSAGTAAALPAVTADVPPAE
eukprot:12915180-Prorocentrum_lima.AAC.1